jgi:spore coat protein CotH
MKTINAIIISIFLIINSIFAQDTLYIFKAGAIVYKSEISTIDSVTFSIPKPVTVNNTLTYIYDINSLPEIRLEITTAEWNNLLSYFDQNPDNEEYIKSDFSFLKNGTSNSLTNVGVRIRGNTSRRRPEGTKGQIHTAINTPWHHASFALSFKKFVKGQKMSGAEKINLKWFKDDATYVREVYCYDLFERFGVWTAPQSSYCRLTIKIKEDANAAYYGVYQLVEPIDKEYLKNRPGKFADSEGNLWKANWGADLKNTDPAQMGIESITLTSTYTPTYDLKTNDTALIAAKTQLSDFIFNLNTKTGDEFKTWISGKMDVELFLKTYAVNVMCGMWDDYWGNKNNFYFYFDSKGKFYFIPYDYDNTLGTSGIMSNSGTQDVLKWGNNTYPLMEKIIAIPEYKALYISYIKNLCNSNNDYFHIDKSMARIIKWQNFVSPYVNNDTKEDTQIIDKPASWGNCSFYRLLDSNNNYFKIRAANIPN